jgi:hypothetical protein
MLLAHWVICPRECSNARTDHCCGVVSRGPVRCFACGRYLPLDEAIDFQP